MRNLPSGRISHLPFTPMAKTVIQRENNSYADGAKTKSSDLAYWHVLGMEKGEE